MWVWNGLYPEDGGVGWLLGLFAALPFAWLALVLWRSGSLFGAPRAPLRERYGEWALVTGASAGIGAAFARELAREGMSLVLSARREDRLRALAAELEQVHAVRTRVIASDLATQDGQDRLVSGVANLELALLVLNAGIGQQGRFEKCDPERLEQMLALNCGAPLRLTRALAPGLISRGRGALIFTGSVAGRQPLPLHAAYAASKAWILLFGEALSVELGERGVDVLVVEPGVTETEFQEHAGELPHAGAAPEAVVAEALAALGIQSSIVPGWYDWLRANVASRLLPRSLAAAAGHGIMERQTPPEMR
jgi:short-subunit dehydrogenase